MMRISRCDRLAFMRYVGVYGVALEYYLLLVCMEAVKSTGILIYKVEQPYYDTR